MNKGVVMSFIFIFALVFGLLFVAQWITNTTGYFIFEGKGTRVASCLTQENSTLYIINDCTECDKQISLFKNDAQLLTIINCDDSPENCKDLPDFYPAWKIQGNLFHGVKDLEDLDYLAQC